MQKPTLVEIGTIAVFGMAAGSLADELADHHVSILAIIATGAAVLTAGLFLALQISQGLRTTLFTCPVKGCTVSIRLRGTSAREADQLRDLATDHSKHPARNTKAVS